MPAEMQLAALISSRNTLLFASPDDESAAALCLRALDGLPGEKRGFLGIVDLSESLIVYAYKFSDHRVALCGYEKEEPDSESELIRLDAAYRNFNLNPFSKHFQFKGISSP